MKKKENGLRPGQGEGGGDISTSDNSCYPEYINFLNSLAEAWEAFIARYCWNDVLNLSTSYPERCSLSVKFTDLDNYDPRLADMLLDEPDKVLECGTRVLHKTDLCDGVTLDTCEVRVIGVPRRKKIKELRSKDGGKLVSLDGIVTKSTEVRPKIEIATFECPFCRHIFNVEQNERGFTEPYECPQENGGCGRKAQRFILHTEKSTYSNAQTLRLQDSPEELRGGELPQAIDIEVTGDISGIAYPGDRIIATGIVRIVQRVTNRGKSRTFDIFIDANSLEQKNEEFENIRITEEDEARIAEFGQRQDIYEKLLESIAPFISGHERIKEATLLQLFGGVSKTLPDGTRLRGDIHTLTVGDPGLAKSQLLWNTIETAPRGIYVDGGGSTVAGLTAAAVKDAEGRWTLEAGTLVLADKGIAAIDEIEKMREDDREKLTIALEQQIVPISKAGINATLNARCAVIAAANPIHGRFDPFEPLSKQINLPPPLLSRFDLIFTIRDVPNKVRDTELATHILDLHDLKENDGNITEVTREFLRKYIATAKRIRPKLTKEVKDAFADYYTKIRHQYGGEDRVSITPRQLQALVRLGEARARARLSNVVTKDDAKRVIDLMDHCLHTTYTDPESGKIDVEWVTEGISHSQREQRKQITKIITDLEREYGNEIPIEKILERAQEEGIPREKAEEGINAMRVEGLLFAPSAGVVTHVV